MFAGRNVSVTHIALSATRLIAICGLVGQAAGTAAAMCMEYKTSPRGVYKKHIPELQERLLRDDCYIPNRPANDGADLARKAKIEASSTTSGNVALLTDGYSRDEVDRIHHWQYTFLDRARSAETSVSVSIRMESGVFCIHYQRSIFIITFINKEHGARKIRTEGTGRQIYFLQYGFCASQR